MVLVVLVGCATMPENTLLIAADTLHLRQLQTKRFDTGDEATVLSACAALLQDLGFKIDESESSIGLLTGSKKRSAKHVVNIVLAVILGVPYDDEQIMRAFVVIRPVGEDGKSHAVRVTFHRTVYNDKREISKVEELQEPEMYRAFFEKLSKALFLEAHDI